MKSMKPLVIIKAGSTFPTIKQNFGDFEDWVVDACDSPDELFSVIDMVESQALPDADRLSGVIITGSHAMVTDQADWVRKLADWIPQVLKQNIPMLGICFGHQILAQSMGGFVAYHPRGREIGTVSITLTPEGKKDCLLGNLPTLFTAHSSHAQTVSRLPDGAQLLAQNSFETHHAYRIGKNAWGVQFHPEFTADIMSRYVIEQTSALINDGYDIETLQSEIRITNKANGLIKRFVEIVKESGK
jgi:GMP synthase (glutamine-hydrolysing)